MKIRKLVVGAALTGAVVIGFGSPAFAHDCFNPNKPAGAGVNYTITGFGPNGPIFEQTGNGKGIGGFASISPDVTGGFQLPDIHTIGNSNNGKEVVGGPGSQTADHACDGKGIDYAEACFGA